MTLKNSLFDSLTESINRNTGTGLSHELLTRAVKSASKRASEADADFWKTGDKEKRKEAEKNFGRIVGLTHKQFNKTTS